MGLRIRSHRGANRIADFAGDFKSPKKVAESVINTIFEPDQEGLYWFDVLFQGRELRECRFE